MTDLLQLVEDTYAEGFRSIYGEVFDYCTESTLVGALCSCCVRACDEHHHVRLRSGSIGMDR